MGPRRSIARSTGEALLSVGALLGVLCVLATVVAMTFDVRPVIFRSGSMSPSIETGALAFSRTVPSADLEKGDVVTVKDSQGITVTHRIEAITRSGGEATLQLRGDANKVSDSETYVVKEAPRVLFDVPKLGYVVSTASGPVGVFAAGLYAGLVLMMLTRRRRDDEPTAGGNGPGVDDDLLVPLATEPSEPSPAPGRRKRARGRRVLVTSLGVGMLGLNAFTAGSTTAAFADSATVTTGVFSQKQTPLPVPTAPTDIKCSVSNGANPSLTVKWSKVTGATSYEVSYVGISVPPGPSFTDTEGENATNSTHAFTTTQIGLYRATVKAKNAAGTSPASTGVTVLVTNVFGTVGVGACVVLGI